MKYLLILLKIIQTVSPFFHVNCMLMFYSVCCNSFFSKIKIELFTAPARRWPRCCRKIFCGWRKLERTWIFELHSCFRSGAQQLFKQKRKKLDTLLLYFIVLVNKVASLIGLSLFHLWVTFQVEVSSYCTLAETFEIGFQNRFYLENNNFGGFG